MSRRVRDDDLNADGDSSDDSSSPLAGGIKRRRTSRVLRSSAPASLSLRDRALARLKRLKAGAAASSSDDDDDTDAASDNDNFEDDDIADDDVDDDIEAFVDDDDALPSIHDASASGLSARRSPDAPALTPSTFPFAPASMDPIQDSFEVYVQYLASAALDPDFAALVTSPDEPDDYFEPALKSIDRRLEAFKTFMVSSNVWSAQFKADLETFPYCDSVSFEDGGSIPCSACARSQHWAVVEMCLSGDPYDPTTLQSKAKFKVGSAQTGLQNGMQTGRQDRLESDDDDVEQSRLRTGVQTDAQIASSRRRDRRRIVDDDDDDDDYDHDSDADADEHDHDPADADAADASPLSVTVHLGKTCAHRADVYHRLHHFRFHLFLEVQAETAKLLRHVTDQMGDAADDVIHAAVVRAMLDGAGMMRSWFDMYEGLLREAERFGR